MCNKVKSLFDQISCYLPYILHIKEESNKYKVIKEVKGKEETLFEGSRIGCITYLKKLKLDIYNCNSQLSRDFQRGW